MKTIRKLDDNTFKEVIITIPDFLLVKTRKISTPPIPQANQLLSGWIEI